MNVYAALEALLETAKKHRWKTNSDEPDTLKQAEEVLAQEKVRMMRLKQLIYGRSLPGPSVRVLDWPGYYRWDEAVSGWQAASWSATERARA